MIIIKKMVSPLFCPGFYLGNIGAGGILRELARASDKRIVFYCAYGERSAMAVQAAQDAGLMSALHVEGGIDAWKRAGGALAR